MTKHMIYSDIDISEQERYIREEYPDLSDTEVTDYAHADLAQDFDDLRSEFDKPVAHGIIAIADIGRWNGRFPGYQDIPSGNLKDCFATGRDIYSAEWYVDQNGDLRSEQRHHDGRHFVLYRGIRGENSEADVEDFKYKILSGTVTTEDIDRYTERLGEEIAKVYGWELKPQKPSLLGTLAKHAAKSREVFGGAEPCNPVRQDGAR